jgi:hypothetical protein
MTPLPKSAEGCRGFPPARGRNTGPRAVLAYRLPLPTHTAVARTPETCMSTSKSALLSILVACWIVGLINQFHAWDTTLLYLILSLVIVAGAVARRQYQMQYAKNRISRRR